MRGGTSCGLVVKAGPLVALAVAMLASPTAGSALQKGSTQTLTPAQVQSTSPQLPDASYGGITGRQRGDDDGFGSRRDMEASRAKMANLERQKAITREAAQLLQVAAELQLRAAKNEAEASPQETLRQIDTIEKLARDVKQKMKGTR